MMWQRWQWWEGWPTQPSQGFSTTELRASLLWLSAESQKVESLCPQQCQPVVGRWSKIAQPGPVWCPTEGQKAGEAEEEEEEVETWDTSTSKFCHTSQSQSQTHKTLSISSLSSLTLDTGELWNNLFISCKQDWGLWI